MGDRPPPSAAPREPRAGGGPRAERALDLVAIGEVMLELSSDAPLRRLPRLRAAVAGDTFNVVAVAGRLGSRTGYVGLVGDDPAGDAVLEDARARGVDARGMRRVSGPTGLYLITNHEDGDRSFSYYREGSVAARLSGADVAASPASTARAVHTSGITLALSPSCREAGLGALEAAAGRGALVSYDVNFRPALVSYARAAGDAAEAARHVHLLSISLDDARALAGVDKAEDAVNWGWSLGAADVLVAEGREGATLGLGSERLIFAVAPPPVEPVDTTGAGDALMGGFLHGRIAGWDPERCLRFACAVAARSVTGIGALGALPTANEADALARGVRSR